MEDLENILNTTLANYIKTNGKDITIEPGVDYVFLHSDIDAIVINYTIDDVRYTSRTQYISFNKVLGTYDESKVCIFKPEYFNEDKEKKQ